MYPITYKEQMARDYFSMQPSEVKGVWNAETQSEKRYLYAKMYSNFEFTIPKYWAKNWFRFFLFNLGSICAIYTKEKGWMCGPYGVTKINAYYQPAQIVYTNHTLTAEKTGIIGINAGIMRVMDDYCGLDDLVTKYAVQLADIDKAININIMNCNVAIAALVKDKKEADELKEAYEEATTGKPFVAINKELLKDKSLSYLIENVKANFVVLDLLQSRREILNQFLTDIGIPNANYTKRAQMGQQEVERNDRETEALVEEIEKTIQEGMDEINSISGLGLSVRLKKGGDNYAKDNAGGFLSLE